MTASERIDEVETSLAETNAALAELRKMSEAKKMELENVILRESLATSNERYTTLQTEQREALQRMNNAQNESAKRLENGMQNLSESVRRMSAALSETVATEVSRVKETSSIAIREISKASGEAARDYQRLFNEAQQRNSDEFEKLMKRRNVIDIVVVVAAGLAIGMIVFIWFIYFKKA